MSKPRILFVDDEAMLLNGLQRNLRRMRDQWETEFVASGATALEAMSRFHFDVIVTDMCMPEMNGWQLLEQVAARYPQTLRFILSGQCDREANMRVANSAHQFLAKPCDLNELCKRLSNSLALRDIVENTQLKQVVLQISALPTMPSVYREIVAALDSPQASVQQVGDIIQQDMALTAKVLQMANSAYFGLGHHVSNPAFAVNMLGIDVIKSLVLSLKVFDQLDGHILPYDFGETLMNHSVVASHISKRVAQLAGKNQAMVDDCFAAGLLHDIGELILASELTSEYAEAMRLAEAEKISAFAAEFKVMGCSHAEIGAYLFAIWGLPSHMIEAVAWHHLPSASPVNDPFPLIAVHLAECVSTRMLPHRIEDELEIDQAFVERFGLRDECELLLQSACGELKPEDVSR